ncbi:hypothetical protein GWO43_30890 [candidate division KSB1 bacterium]|nr:hypothetical protein [candidate division KSB1 bacterium]NIR73078.1 hypothetical protein [candidate division KSB1 bacterium]NIS28319.1 hypothetical protein [candidate division KSB1 bacterium]NIT75188.1 hypothetical protein [candidate division KSB1 bacterium]NIU29025.1 hypothetical protein [candidate division KSB1 bacterium]
MEKPFDIDFENGRRAKAVRVFQEADLPTAIQELGLTSPVPTLVLIGGAGGITKADMQRLRPLFVDVLARLAADRELCIIDGGTDAGIMQLMGRARRETNGSFSLIGVAAQGTIELPQASSTDVEKARLEPNHSHFIVVPGDNWGDESVWISRTADLLSKGMPSCSVLINGGENARKDVTNSTKVGRPVLVISGTGRLADEMASASEKSLLIKITTITRDSKRLKSDLAALLEEG